ncbi:hypothetical protein J2Z60_000469 [Lactobacillus colini]|uniref:Replication initiation protein-like C-terminal domain-containing protein n=1 Tax=Lactobacillus colini TaxID=1819254 RepID=A0ABS4MCA0_9LACO|nr:replication initiation factor domain-containing protein [Lactobacillus colini]MBP2057305.1 hypothetical protein [Lactobacillus colini]
MTKIFATVDQVTINLPYIDKFSGQDSAITYAEKLHLEEVLGEMNKGRGLNYYSEAITFYKNQVKIMWNDKRKSQGILLYFTATGYKAWKSLGRLQGYCFDLLNLVSFMTENHAKWFTRFDDAIDIFDSDLTIEDLYQQVDIGKILVLDGLGRRIKTENQRFYGQDRKMTGFTVGSRSSDNYLRIYDKKIEQTREDAAYLDLARACKSWIRIEGEFKHDKAKAILKDLSSFAEKDDKNAIQQKLVGYIIGQWQLTNSDKRPIKLWQQLSRLADGKGAILPLEPRLTDRLVQELKWFLTGGAAGVFYRVSELFGEIGKADFLLFMFEYVSKPNRKEHFSIPKNMTSDLELIIKQHPNIQTINFYLDKAVKEIEKDKEKDTRHTDQSND